MGDYLWAAISEQPDEHDSEGLVSIYRPELGGWYPLICFHERNVEAVTRAAMEAGAAGGKKVKIVKFMRVKEE